MTSIEVLATIFAIVILVRLVILLINPQLWMNIAEALLSRYTVATVVYLVLAVIVGYYIFASLNIVQVAAVMLFTSILIGLALVPYSRTMLKVTKEIVGTRSDVFRKAWLAVVIWGGIAVWVLYTVFA